MVAILRPFEEVITSLYEIKHTIGQLKELAEAINTLDGETRVVLDHTGKYCEPVVKSGIFVSAVNPLLVKEYGNNSIRKVKTDSADALKIAKYTLDDSLAAFFVCIFSFA